MKFEKLNENKLKITLSNNELPNNKSLDDLMSNSSSAKESLLSILEKAHKIVGFDTTDYKIRIDAKSLNNKDCLFYITKLDKLNKPQAHVQPRKMPKYKNANQSIYKFESFDDICKFVSYVDHINIEDAEKYSKKSSVYKYNDNYFLVFSNINHRYSDVAAFNSSITEFSTFYSSKDVHIAALNEKGDSIIKEKVFDTCRKYFK